MEIGAKLKDARMEVGLTQENVAEEIQVSRQTISNWENENRDFKIAETIMKINPYSLKMKW